MTREEANRILECMAIDLTGALSRAKEPMADVLLQRLEAINVAQDALTPQNEWVSVEEKLPEEHADILMWRKRWKIAEAGTFHIGRFWVYDEIGDSYTADDITHWMPLPEPPKEV